MTATHVTTVEALERHPPEGRWELAEGELVEMAPAGGESAEAGLRIGGLIMNHVWTNRLGRTFGSEGGFVLFPDRQTVRAPDVAFISVERLPLDARVRGFVRLAPDLVVEVMSPSDRLGDAIAKVGEYLQAGVRLVWLVRPEEQTVTAFTPDAPPATLTAADTLAGGEVLPGFAVPVADLFPWANP